MQHNFFKRSIAAVLTATLVLTPANTNFAAEKPNSTSNLNVFTNTSPYQTVPFELPSSVSTQSGKYKVQSTPAEIKTIEDVQSLAEKKANIITNLYGETSVQYALIDNGVVTVSGQAGVYSKETAAG